MKDTMRMCTTSAFAVVLTLAAAGCETASAPAPLHGPSPAASSAAAIAEVAAVVDPETVASLLIAREKLASHIPGWHDPVRRHPRPVVQTRWAISADEMAAIDDRIAVLEARIREHLAKQAPAPQIGSQ